MRDHIDGLVGAIQKDCAEMEAGDSGCTSQFYKFMFRPFVIGWQATSWPAEKRNARRLDFLKRTSFMATLASTFRAVTGLIVLSKHRTLDRTQMEALKKRIADNWYAIKRAIEWKRLIAPSMVSTVRKMLDASCTIRVSEFAIRPDKPRKKPDKASKDKSGEKDKPEKKAGKSDKKSDRKSHKTADKGSDKKSDKKTGKTKRSRGSESPDRKKTKVMSLPDRGEPKKRKPRSRTKSRSRSRSGKRSPSKKRKKSE
jgi:hypothetical protein